MSHAGRIAACFERLKRERRTGLITYHTVGYPTLTETASLVSAAIEGGASLIELGVPFSDPLADGTTIQRANTQALRQGVRLAHCLDVAKAIRSQYPELPLLLMGYYNTFLSYGLGPFCRDSAQTGVDGAIVVDLPPEEATAFLDHAQPFGLELIFLLAPTSTPERIRKVVAKAQGFIYCVSVAGVTGARDTLPEDLPEFVARIRRYTQLPLAVGFGVSRQQHVQAVGRLAEAAVVGSALVDIIDRRPPEERVAAVRSFVTTLLKASPQKR